MSGWDTRKAALVRAARRRLGAGHVVPMAWLRARVAARWPELAEVDRGLLVAEAIDRLAHPRPRRWAGPGR